ncbi:hypothetical protein QR680_011949 [Steinernema hermaphroditum]|uniref:Uncharacterized protein n=1 Tax=Steinernema hermaphroditum TaxID=289476 RepID=A0AA39I2N3_9BILA|nr:hypothetical protein QR680_011949 [Steinernema hermaphroditum]
MYVYVILTLLLSVGYGCHPMVGEPSLNPGPVDVQTTDAPSERTTTTPGGAIDEGSEDKEDELQKLIAKLTAAEWSLTNTTNDIEFALKILEDRPGNRQIDEKMAADKAVQDLAAAEDKLKSAKGSEEQANEVLNAVKKQRDEENDPVMKPAKEQTVTDAEKELEEAKEAVKTAQEERDTAQMEQIVKARDRLPTVEDLQKKKEKAEKKNKEVVESIDKVWEEFNRSHNKKENLEEEIAQLKKKIEELKAKKKE